MYVWEGWCFCVCVFKLEVIISSILYSIFLGQIFSLVYHHHHLINFFLYATSSPSKLFLICNIIILYITSLVGLWICCLFFSTHLNGDYLCFFSTTIDCTLIFKRLYVHKFPSSELLPPLVPPKDERRNGLFMDKEVNIAKGCFFHLDCLVFPLLVFFFPSLHLELVFCFVVFHVHLCLVQTSSLFSS